MPVFGPRELKKHVLDQGLCVGCGACAELCPYLRIHNGRMAMLFDCDLERGSCYAHCPKTGEDPPGQAPGKTDREALGHPLGNHRRIIAARKGRRLKNGGFQAGGTVSALTISALEDGIIKQAVLTDRQGPAPLPRIVFAADEVLSCAGSKYMTAPTLSALNLALSRGMRQIGVVATPCQTTGLAKLRSNPLGKDAFLDPVSLVIGLFCTWALDPLGFTELLHEMLPDQEVIKMDITPPPQEMMIIDTKKGRTRIPLDRLRSLVPAGCSICPDMTAEQADVSVGVIETRPDWNLVIVRSEQGQELVERACSKGLLQTGSVAAETIQHLQSAALNKKQRALQKTCPETGGAL
ncbi:MAG: Coenzyme F420 hydrogenase/dehydrogenase, beta subunit C-terminal domain [Thermodesulfobacteriota bacterium]